MHWPGHEAVSSVSRASCLTRAYALRFSARASHSSCCLIASTAKRTSERTSNVAWHRVGLLLQCSSVSRYGNDDLALVIRVTMIRAGHKYARATLINCTRLRTLNNVRNRRM